MEKKQLFSVLPPKTCEQISFNAHPENYYVSQPSQRTVFELPRSKFSLIKLTNLSVILSRIGIVHLAVTSLNSRPPSVFIYILTYYQEPAVRTEVINFCPMMCQSLDNSNYILMSEKLSVK